MDLIKGICRMKKRNKFAIAVTTIILLLGILLVLTGFFGDWFLGLFSKSFDARSIKPEDLGKSIKSDIFVYYDNAGDMSLSSGLTRRW